MSFLWESYNNLWQNVNAKGMKTAQTKHAPPVGTLITQHANIVENNKRLITWCEVNIYHIKAGFVNPSPV